MLGYPISYGDNLEYGNGFTSEAVINNVLEYWTEENKQKFKQGYIFGTALLSVLVFGSELAFAEDSSLNTGNIGSSGPVPASGAGPGSGPGSCPAPGPGAGPGAGPGRGPGSLATVPTTERGAYVASALGICGIAMKTGAFWIGFVCAGAVIVGARMASIPANSAL